jgi:hypothetical protein
MQNTIWIKLKKHQRPRYTTQVLNQDATILEDFNGSIHDENGGHQEIFLNEPI